MPTLLPTKTLSEDDCERGGFAINFLDHIRERLTTRDGLLLVSMNLVPLVGAVMADWDGLAVMLYYWLETVIIGFWVVIRVANTPVDGIGNTFGGSKGTTVSPVGLAIFIVAHAAIFMGVHLFFLLGLFGDGRSRQADGPLGIFARLLFERGLWLPLAGFALIRGVFAISDWRAGYSTGPAVVDFYLRILVMQLAVLLGGWVFLVLQPLNAFLSAGVDAALGGVVALVLVKTGAELFSGPLSHAAQNALNRAAEKQQG